MMKWHLSYVVLLLLSLYCLVIKGQITVSPEMSEYVVSEDIGVLSVCINISVDVSDSIFTVNITTNMIDNQATINEDYSQSTSVLSISTNESQSCFDVTIIDDALHEPNKFINLTLSSPDLDVVFNGSSIVIEIQSNDPAILKLVPLIPDNVTEGNVIEICYNITVGELSDISVILFDVSDTGTTAMDILDYEITNSSVSGSTFCCDLLTLDDDVFEAVETINFTISSNDPLIRIDAGYDIISIIDNDVLSVNLLNTSVMLMEGDLAKVCLSIDTTIETSTMFTLNTSSINDVVVVGNDSVAVFPPNSTGARCVTIMAVNDNMTEGEETFTVIWMNSDNRAGPDPLSITVIIEGHLTPSLDNDTLVYLTEGDPVVVCVSLDGVATKPLHYNYTTEAETASIGDSIPNSGMIEIERGEKVGCSTIQTVDNNVVDGTRNFTVSFVESSISSMTVNIMDNDVGCVGFNQSSVTLNENTGSYSTQLVSTCDNITAGFHVVFMYENGTAVAGRDFNFMDTAPIYWTMSNPPSVTVNITNDNVVNPDRTFYLTLCIMASSDLNISTSISRLQLTVVNDDKSTINTPSMVTYNSTGQMEVCFKYNNKITSPEAYTLIYTTMDGSAQAGRDYILPNGNVTLPSQPSELKCIRIEVSNQDTSTRTMFTIIWAVESPDLELGNTETTVNLNIFVPVPSSTSSTATPTSQVSSAITSNASPTGTSTSGFAGLGIYPIIGIIVGVVAVGVVCLLLLVCVLCCVKMRMNRQGFYVTNEDKGEAPHMLRYSASLRSLQSQTVMPADSREKENEYMV